MPPKLTTIDISKIESTKFKVTSRKNNTSIATRKCPVPDPDWLTNLVNNCCQLSLQNVLIQAGRHFSDRINLDAFGPDTSKRQAAMAMAWTIASLLSPVVKNDRLVVTDPRDGDIKRLCSEILGVGFALEVLRNRQVIDGRTIKKLSNSFDYEATRKWAQGRVKIEAKGTFEDASTSEHRTSIFDKISESPLPRGYDSHIGIIASLWPEAANRKFDIEICDPDREPESVFEFGVRDVIAFYARRFDEAVGLDEGTKLLFGIAAREDLFEKGQRLPLIPTAAFDRRHPVNILYHNRLVLRHDGRRDEFWGNFWETKKLPINLILPGTQRFTESVAFMGINSTIFRLISGSEFDRLLEYETEESLFASETDQYRAIFSQDSYGVICGLIEGELPYEMDVKPHRTQTETSIEDGP